MKRKRSVMYARTRNTPVTFQKETLTFLVLLTAGILIGAFTAKQGNDSVITQVESMFNSFYTIRESQSILLSVSNSLKVYAGFWALNLLFGLCAIGIPFIAVLPTIRGLGIGLVTGYIYSIYGLKGMGYCFLVIFPGALLSFIAMIYAASDAFKMSLYTFGSVANTVSQKGHSDKIKIYIVRQLFYFILLIAAAFLDGIVNKVFAGIFTFL